MISQGRGLMSMEKDEGGQRGQTELWETEEGVRQIILRLFVSG